MNAVKVTRKGQAIALLKTIETGEEWEVGFAITELDNITTMQAGYGAPAFPFCTSVDACLTLPLDEFDSWQFEKRGAYDLKRMPDKKAYKAVIWHGKASVEADTLPIAILKAWWSIQPD